jgi:hypothetical protein
MLTVRLLGGKKTTGELVFEEVPVEKLERGQYRLLASPGLVLGVAKGDLICLDDSLWNGFAVRERSGNLCIQLFCDRSVARDCGVFEAELDRIGGVLDGKSDRQLVFTVPYKVGFAKIQYVLDKLVKDHPGYEWYYGNVYDPRDGITPLGWWK